jgi:hypothetical protein
MVLRACRESWSSLLGFGVMMSLMWAIETTRQQNKYTRPCPFLRGASCCVIARCCGEASERNLWSRTTHKYLQIEGVLQTSQLTCSSAASWFPRSDMSGYGNKFLRRCFQRQQGGESPRPALAAFLGPCFESSSLVSPGNTL